MLISSLPKRGSVLIDKDGKATEAFAIFLSQLSESNNQDSPKCNYSASAAPLTTDNASQGYTVGSEWIYLNVTYKLTSFTSGNATWTALN